MITVHNVEQGSDEWLELRRGLYTGSNAHKLLAAAGSHKMVDGVISKYAANESTSFMGNFWTKRGHLLEDEAIELYEAIKKRQVKRPGFVTNTEFPGCGYSPDGDDDGVTLEVKSFDIPNHMKLVKGDIDIKILAQIHFGLTIWDRKLARLIAYNPKVEPKLALKIIDISAKKSIKDNFKRVIKQEIQV